MERAASTTASVALGIPQGSEWAPLLVFIYVNDLGYLLRDINVRLMNYANGMNVLLIEEDHKRLAKKLDSVQRKITH